MNVYLIDSPEGFNCELLLRNEDHCPRSIQANAERKTSDDVQCYAQQGHTSGLQEIHARCNQRINGFSFTDFNIRNLVN